MEDIGGGLHSAVGGQSLDEDEDETYRRDVHHFKTDTKGRHSIVVVGLSITGQLTEIGRAKYLN